MTANEALGEQFPARLFHGSAYDLQGDTLRPGVQMGASGARDYHAHLGQSNREVVSASGHEGFAWNMAGAAGPGRQRVYEVEPHPQTRIGVENPRHPDFDPNQLVHNDEYVAPSFKVVKQHDIMPGHQGTFPINWNKHANPGGSSYPRQPPLRVNHPAPGDDVSRAETAAHGEQRIRDLKEYRGGKLVYKATTWDDLNSGALFTDRRPAHSQGVLF